MKKSSLELLSPVWTHLTTIRPVRGEGAYLYDENGAGYLDFTCGIGVTNTGHCHPTVVKAVKQQAEKLLFGQMNIVVPPATLKLAEKLNAVTPVSINRFFFSNSGAEAVEACVKLAKQATGRQNVIVFQGSFHGRTHQTMAMTTSKYAYRYKYQPLPGGVFVAPFPYAYYYGWNAEKTVDYCLQQLDLLLHSQTAPDEVAAMVIEPILGEGGYISAPPAFLEALQEICHQYGILLAIDEVQSGFGRTGKFFGYEYANIVPDILVMAKGLGSGLPISAIGANETLMAKWQPGTHGGTYGGGSAIASAAAAATIDVILQEKLAENAASIGSYLMQRLQKLLKKYPQIGDVRGHGLMVATEFTDENRKPDKQTAAKVQQACLARSLLLLSCGSYGNTIRLIPPLIVTQSQIDEALAIFEAALND